MLASYLATFISFGVVLMLTLSLWRGRLQGWWLIQALALVVLWSGYLTVAGADNRFNPSNQTFLDILRSAGWALLLWKLSQVAKGERPEVGFWSNRWLWLFIGWVLLLLLGNMLSRLDVFDDWQLFDSIGYLAPFSLSLIVLVLLEQWYRSIVVEQRWSIKFLVVATAVMFGGDFLLFSEAFLFARVDPVLWEARGWLYASMAPLVAISIARCRDWNRESRVSHQAVFFTTSVVLAGVYLIVMALVGYYLRWFGAGISSAVQVVFVVLVLSVLVLVLTSGRYRSVLAVWISKHFLSYKYDYRDQWMRANARFASLKFDQEYFDQLILGVAEPVDSLGGIIWVEDGDQLVVKGHWSLRYSEPLDPQRDKSLLRFCADSAWIINLDEYRYHPERYQGLSVSAQLLDMQAMWLLVPLVHQGHLYGVVALARPRTERSVTWEEHDLLKALGGQVAALLALRNVTESLASARQFEAFNQLSTFVVHDIKNVVAQLSLLVRNAERHRHNPEFIDDALETLSSAVSRMNRMLSQLKQRVEPSPAVVFEVGAVLQEVIEAQKNAQPAPVMRPVKDALWVNVDRDRLVAALCHLVQNAQDATPADGEVRITLSEQPGLVQVEVMDTGCGMDQAFISSSLFKPFVSTKGRAGMGIGVFEARQFAQENGGGLVVTSTPGKGSTFTLSLPKLARVEQSSGVASGQG